MPVRLADVNPGVADGIISTHVAMANGLYFFVGKSFLEGQELWVSDGTVSGTHMVKDINPGQGSGFVKTLMAFKDKVWFVADDGVTGPELWYSDGTASGTSVIDVVPGAAGAEPNHITQGADYLFFKGLDANYTPVLYRTDGTPAGTQIVVAQVGNTPVDFVSGLAAIGNTVYISFDGPTSAQLWKSDGTQAGTVLVKDMNPGQFGLISNMTPVGNKLYFGGSKSLFPEYQPWVSDGTSAGTFLLKNIYPNEDAAPKWFTEFKGKVYFYAEAANGSRGLYRTDGTSPGTQLFKEISISAFFGEEYNMASDGNYLYFSGLTVNEGRELWRTDGNAAGTVMVKDINPGSASSNPIQLSFVDGQVYFSANFAGNGEELCKTDGTNAGTVQMTDFNPNNAFNATPWAIRKVGNVLVFSAEHPSFGRELFALQLTSDVAEGFNNPVLVYPNPTDNQVVIELPDDLSEEQGLMQVFASDGQLVYQQVCAEPVVTLSVQGWAQGLYLLEYSNARQRIVSKLLVAP
ncbi:MAG TPA: ELWxxDGT repeat protein [Saprospiraceae bacterium]|nr:ELWxxDGT repeat protein [Saprospiraceae bacterium]